MERSIPSSQSLSNDSPIETDNVAIIAVHGVGSQPAHVTARELAGLLQRANPGTYSEFTATVLDLEISKPVLPDDRDAALPAKPAWYVRTRYTRAKAAMMPDATKPASVSIGNLSDDLAFTSKALADVEIDATLKRYQTRVLSGTRSSGGKRHRVDIFEMYWADLSHLAGWLGQVLGQFYQLLFHVAALGQKTVELAWTNAEQVHRRRLTPVLIAQTVVEWLLAGVLPIGNLALLLAILPATVTLLPDDDSRDLFCAAICGVIAGLAVITITCLSLWKHVKRKDYRSSNRDLKKRIAIAVFSAVVIGILAAYLAGSWAYSFGFWWFTPSTLLFVVLSIICGTILCWFSHRFALHRTDKHGGDSVSAPNVMTLASLLVWAILLVTALYEFAAEPDETILYSTLRVVEGIFFLVQISWISFILAAWATCGFAWWALIRGAPGKVRAAIWTGKIALFVPATLFLLVTSLMWSAFAMLIKKTLPNVENYDSLFSYSGSLIQQALGCGTTSSLYGCMDRLVEISASPGFNLFLLFVIAAVVLAIIGMLPSIIRESRPTLDGNAAESAALGTWLDAGFVVLRIAGYINLIGLLVILPIVQLVDVMPGLSRLKEVIAPLHGTSALLYLTGVVIGAAGLGVLFRNALFDALGKALDIGLDVDNWLRERPIEQNPRGRILSRYLSLLNYISDPRKGYDRIVIVSHSQGTVISADLLRLIAISPSLLSTPLPITLLTFGCPLRQLYGLRFPDLYGWARTSVVTPRVPDPAALSVDKWINGYRSGDYVGRYLWTDIQQWQPYVDAAEVPEGSWEFCLDAGAHTHYFDATATAVGKVINRVVARA